MSFIVLDLETVRDRSLPVPPPRRCGAPLFREPEMDGGRVKHCEAHVGPGACSCCGAPPQNPFLPPPFHRIVSLGYAILDDRYLLQSLGVMLAPLPEDEPRVLQDFFDALATFHRPTLVTFAGRQFDVPVLCARAFRFGVPFPWYYSGTRGADPRYRYSDAGHLDLMDQLCDMGSSPKAQMDIWARSMGLPGKGDVHGGDVEELFAESRLEEIADYNACDVVQEAGILCRYELLRGKATREECDAAVRLLLGEIAQNKRLRSLRGMTRDGVTGEVAGLDVGRVYLTAGEGEEAVQKAVDIEGKKIEKEFSHLDPLAPVEEEAKVVTKKRRGSR